MVKRVLQKAAALFLGLIWAQMALAQQTWVQVEALPSATRALERAEAYAQRFQDINAFRTGSTWHVIAIGPFNTPDEARLRLLELRAARAIPSDSFVSDGRSFRDRIFGTGIANAAPTTPSEPAPVLEPGEETPAEARRSERTLDRSERELLQTALKFEGFYNSIIDASFGPGTRRAMADWQRANGYEPTGILTTLQRRELIVAYQSVQASLGVAPYVDTRAGIEIDLPLNMVTFDRYESPFVHFEPSGEDTAKVVLISQSGGDATLTALFDIMQTLEIAPLGSDAQLGRQSFTIDGRNGEIISHIFARRAGEAVKGYALIFSADDEKRFRIALSAMQTSFRTTTDVLPDNAGGGEQNIDLMSGLEIRRADKTRSGFYIDSSGSVLTTSDAVRQCSRITLDGDVEAELVAEDPQLGLAMLQPVESLAPLSVARLAAAQPRIQSDIAIAGYSFGGLLSAPSITFGTLADVKGLDGNESVQRLSVSSEPGDAGGPVFDASGVVLGMLLAPSDGARQLPDDVAFAADAPVLVEFLSANGVTPAAADPGDTLAPEDLTLLAADLTVLVSCWN